MKRKLFLALILMGFLLPMNGQQTPDNDLPENSPALTQQIKKFDDLCQKKDYEKAIEEGVKTSILYTENRNYKDAFATCRTMDALINRKENATGKPQPELKYEVCKERLRMYMRIRKADQCKQQLDKMLGFVNQIKKREYTEDLLFTKARFYKQFNQPAQSLQCYKELIQQRTTGNDEATIEKSFSELLAHAQKEKNSDLAMCIQQTQAEWKDSIKSVKTALSLKKLKAENNENIEQLAQKEETLSSYKGYVTTLCIFSILLIGALVVLLGILSKSLFKTKKLTQSLRMANENNDQKSQFITHIGAQLEPSLDEMENELHGIESSLIDQHVKGIKKLFKDFQSFTELEKTRETRYELKDLDINSLCESIMEKAKVDFKPEVETVLLVPRVHIKTNPKALEQILLYLLKNAATHTEQGKITLEFKKRSAHTGQFMVTDTGCGIPTEERIHLFKPFSKIYNLTQGNGLGLPTCNLMAYKLNGVLHLDTDYKKGTRFVLELHS